MIKQFHIATIATLLCASLSTVSLFAQRKDTDAKISRQYYKYGALNRKTIGTADARILYAFNAENISDKGTWIDEGQLKIAKG